MFTSCFVTLLFMFSFEAYPSQGQPVSISQTVLSLWPKDQAQILNSSRTDHWYKGVENTKNYLAEFRFASKTSRPPLILLTGLEDPPLQWFDFVLQAKDNGYGSIFIIELRGQGLSSRVKGNQSGLIHLNKFSNYYLDLEKALQKIESLGGLAEPAHVMAHSTGALVFLKTFSKNREKAFPLNRFSKLALWTPLIQLAMSPWLDNSIVRPILDFTESTYTKCCGLLVGRNYPKDLPFENNGLTSDLPKHIRSEKLRQMLYLNSTGVSLCWGLDALRESKTLELIELPNLELETLIVQGSKDKVVSNQFAVRNQRIQKVMIDGALHGLHFEHEKYFLKATESTLHFFNQK